MRFTVKAKLASAFGAVTILSMITGGIAYTKLTALDVSEQGLVTQAERMKKSSDLINQVQAQLRAELRMILATTDKESIENQRLIIDRRAKSLKNRDDLYSLATENGKRHIEQINPKLQRFNELQEQSSKFALLNSSNHAAALWASEGLPALREFNSAADAASAEINKAPASIDGMRGLLALQTSKYETARYARSVITSI